MHTELSYLLRNDSTSYVFTEAVEKNASYHERHSASCSVSRRDKKAKKTIWKERMLCTKNFTTEKCYMQHVRNMIQYDSSARKVGKVVATSL